MRDEDEPPLEVVDGVGEGVDGLHVEVVGGLVEEQHVRRLPRQPREHHATPLPVGQLLDGARLQGWEGWDNSSFTWIPAIVARGPQSICLNTQQTAEMWLHGPNSNIKYDV